MVIGRDKDIIEHWVRLYNRATGSTFKVEDWPDRDSSKKNIDAVCRDDNGRTLAVEHTLIQPFLGEKSDSARFLRTLAMLENNRDLLQPGHTVIASQPVGSVPAGANWGEIQTELLKQLRGVLPSIPSDGRHYPVVIQGKNWTMELHVTKMRAEPHNPGRFLTARIHPGDPGPELIIKALKKKIPKLAAFVATIKILLLEKDAVAGMIESQFEQLPQDPELTALLDRVDEIWSVNTAGLETESIIFTNRVKPTSERSFCSLNVLTGEFWQVS
jgi:hypothetical protein